MSILSQDAKVLINFLSRISFVKNNFAKNHGFVRLDTWNKTYNTIQQYSPLSRNDLLKLYLNDVGMLSVLLFLYKRNDTLNENLGAIYENDLAMELAASGYQLFYYD